jgi:hypothetical protein
MSALDFIAKEPLIEDRACLEPVTHPAYHLPSHYNFAAITKLSR